MTDHMAVIEAAKIVHVSVLVGELARCDVSGLSHEEFLQAHDAAARLARLADALESRFAGDLARRSAPELPGGGLAKRQGFATAGSMVAQLTGRTQAAALRSIEAGKAFDVQVTPADGQPGTARCADEHAGRTDVDPAPAPSAAPRYPAVAQAVLVGDLSVDAAGLMTAGLETLTDRVPSDVLHDLERRMVSKAVGLAVNEVRRMVSRAVARADLRGHEEREKRQHAERYIAFKEDHTGMVTFTGKLDAVTAAPIRTVIEQVVTQAFRARRDQDPSEQDQRTVGQMRADALFEICRHALGCKETDSSGIRTTMVVRMDKTDLDAGQGLGSVDGTDQPISIRELRRLAGDAGVIPAVLSGDSEVLDLGRTKRMFTKTQRLALLERDGGCAKCHAPTEHCEAHHIRWWNHGGLTDLANGVMLCTRCHHDVHRQHWDIQVRHGRVSFIPPATIDPTRTPRLGGRAALDIDDPTDNAPARAPGEDSARRQAAREGSALNVAA